jgi:hypothetical protein
MHVHNKATPVGAMPGVTRYGRFLMSSAIKRVIIHDFFLLLGMFRRKSASARIPWFTC